MSQINCLIPMRTRDVQSDNNQLLFLHQMTHRLIVLRHGESQWNHENKFCGWIDVPLSPKGEKEAQHAGELLRRHNINPDVMYTSMLQRSIKTGQTILEEIDRMWIPTYKTWRLNERHYGSFQGRDKNEVFQEYGKEKYQYYRRDFYAVPPETESTQTDSSIDEKYELLADFNQMPKGESLQMTMDRLIPYVMDEIVGRRMLQENRTVLVVTHGSIVRSLIKHFAHVSNEDISKINAPTGVPMVFELNERGELAREFYYLDEELAQRGIAKVAMEGHSKL